MAAHAGAIAVLWRAAQPRPPAAVPEPVRVAIRSSGMPDAPGPAPTTAPAPAPTPAPAPAPAPRPVDRPAERPTVTQERQPPAPAQPDRPAPAVNGALGTAVPAPPPPGPAVGPASAAASAPAAGITPRAASGPRDLLAQDIDYLRKPTPVYPPAAQRARESGTVQLRVLVDVHGRPVEVTVARSSGYRRLDEAALRAVREARFRPYMEDGVPREAVIPDLEIVFRWSEE